MCGIVALYRAGTAATVTPMLDVMTHRGPDDAGVVEVRDGVLGVRRLSIIDVAGGHQPVANESESVWAVLNGEIYNHPILREELRGLGHVFRSGTDTEVLVHGYEAWGFAGLLTRLRGMFAIALADTRSATLWLARDRLGVKPLYLARAGTGWAAASEIKALFRHPAIGPALDEARIPESLANRFVSGDRTAFANVSKLLPGHWLKLEDGAAEVGRYWSIPDPAPSLPVPVRDLPAAIRSRLEEAVRIRLISDVPLGALLSGGLDSSIVVAAMSAAGASPVRTFTVGFDEPERDERAAAHVVALRFATVHTERVVPLDAARLLGEVVWHLDEPLGDAAALPTLLICRAARESVTVVLTGEGADELFLGYPRYFLSRIADLAVRAPTPVRGALLGLSGALPRSRLRTAVARLATAERDVLVRNALWMSGTDPTTLAALTRRPADGWREWFVASNTDAAPTSESGLADVLRRDLSEWLVNDVLLKVDKMSMAASVEARTPFLDHELVEFVARLPVAARVAASGKRWLREAYQGSLPEATLRRAKHALRVPLAEWFRGDLGDGLTAAHTKRGSFTERYLDRPTVTRLLAEHRAGADHSLLLWSVLVHEAWWERFFASGSPS